MAPQHLLWMALAFAAMVAVAVAQQPQVVAIAHRGLNREYPENTLPAFEAALQRGADFVEVDTRTTADGALVVIHDSTVDRTTNGTGPVSSFTLAEIRALDAGSWFAPQYAGLRVPTFEEVATLVRRYERRIYIDFKDGSAEDMFTALTATDMVPSVVVYGGPVQQKQLQQYDVRIKPMPEAVNRAVLNASIAFFDPLEVVAFNDNDFRDELIQQARAIPADVYVDRLGAADTPEVWQDAVDRGATGIQSDFVGDLVAYLRAGGYHP